MAAYMMNKSLFFRFLKRGVIQQNMIPIPVAQYAKKAGKAASKASEPEPEIFEAKDPEDLVKYCVGLNYFKEGPEIELKPDSEYPDWLWNLHIGPPQKLDDMDPNTRQYWRKLRKMHMKRNNALSKGKKF
ncbi:large ribosomal subunit protein mL54-like [Antedon mediterranea]|uniref:large ribosomal subunit protein mL54-like n=1 Tax=Antedon mediterranea TaxID=105859 RepID=UPI003AF46ED6